MPIASDVPEVLLSKLLQARSSEDVERALERFCRGWGWKPFNNDRGNKGLIKLSSDPIRALVERVTNGFDAVVERAVKESGTDGRKYTCPKEAVDDLFPTNESRKNRVLIHVDNKVTSGTATQKNSRSTVDVLDFGTGIEPTRFPDTILSLSKNNKISPDTRFYIGVYGQGGAASIGCIHTEEGYVVIVSRASDTAPVGFTVIRYHGVGKDDLRGYYEYLVTPDGAIPSANAPKGVAPKKLDIPHSLGEIVQGTLVRHFGYDLSVYRGSKAADKDWVGKALDTYLFRPMFPIALKFPNTEYKTGKKAGNAHLNLHSVEGFASRLEGDNAFEFNIGDGVKGTEYQSNVMSRSLLGEAKKDLGNLRVMYYVLRQPPINPKTKQRVNSSLTIAQASKSVIGTLNGQTQDQRTLDDISRKIREKYPLICGGNHLVVEIQVDGLNRSVKDNLLVSNRESFTDGEYLSAIRKQVSEYLLNDEYLEQCEAARLESTLTSNRKNGSTISKAIQFGLNFFANTLKGVQSVVSGGKKRTRRPPAPPAPIKLNKVAPTFVRFVADEVKFNLLAESNRRHFQIETDAPNGYANPTVEIEGEGASYLHCETISALHNGRYCIAIELDKDKGRLGWVGEIKVSYSASVHAEIMYEFIERESAPRTKNPAKGKGGTQTHIPKVNLEPIGPTDVAWGTINAPEDADTFAFRPIESNGELFVYYNREFPALLGATKDLTEAEEQTLIDHYEAALTVASLALHGSKGWGQDETEQVEAARAATATAVAMTSAQLLAATTRRKTLHIAA